MLFEGLSVANRGLSAAQLGISVTGQNITNASDETYSRKRIEQSAAWKRNATYGQLGFGVEVYAVNRVRDQFIDRLVNQESTRYGYYEMKTSSYNRIESVFGEPSEHAFNTLLNNFWNGWAEVANDPSKAGPREALRSASQALVEQFHAVSKELSEYKDTLNDEIEARINRINELTTGIYRCNTIIATSEPTVGTKANDTRDQRDAMLNELSKLVNVDYFEDEQGNLSVSTNGHLLVSGARSHELVIARVKTTDASGNEYAKVQVSFTSTGKEFKPSSGEIRALMDARDVDVPEYENYINEIAKSLITEVNKIHQNGYALNGLTFIEFFDSNPDKMNAAKIDISDAVKKDINNIAAGTGGQKLSVENLVIPQTQTIPIGTSAPVPIPSGANPDTLRITDASNALLVEGTDYNIVNGQIVFTAASTPADYNISFSSADYIVDLVSPDEEALGNGFSSYQLDLKDFDNNYRFIYKNSLVITTTDTDGKKVPLQEGRDYDVDYNTGLITFKYSANGYFSDVAPNIGPRGVNINFDYHENGYGGPGDGNNAHALAQLRDKAVMQSDLFGRDTQTINQFYSGMLGRLGTERNKAESGFQTRGFALLQLKTQQQEVMGVNMDEEISNLIKYQHTYTASARYLTTINSMLETLLNM